MRGLGWIRLGALALTLLVAAPSAEPQGIIANVCNTAGGWCLLPPGTVVQITRPCRGYTTAAPTRSTSRRWGGSTRAPT